MPQFSREQIRDEVTALVGSILTASGRNAAIDPDAMLVDAGLASVDMVNLMLGVEASFDLMIPREDLTPENFRSVASVEAMVARLIGLDQPLSKVA